MKKLFFTAIMALLPSIFLSCGEKTALADVHHLNGYWEIEKVTFTDGKSKDYKFNPTIDFFKVKDLKGYRKKVQPKLNGTFETSDDAEPFSIAHKEGLLTIHYKNGMNERSERFTEISPDRFTIITANGTTYSYKRHQPINGNN